MRSRNAGGGSVIDAYGIRSRTCRSRHTSAASASSSPSRRSSACASSRRSSPSTYWTSWSSEASRGSLMPSSHQIAEGLLEGHQGPPGAALDGPERRIEIGGDLGLTEALEVGELEHLPPRLGQRTQGGAHPVRALLHRDALQWREGPARRGGGLVPGPQQPYRATPAPQPVDRPRACHRRQEGAHRTTAGVVSGVLIHGQEDLLGEVLS